MSDFAFYDIGTMVIDLRAANSAGFVVGGKIDLADHDLVVQATAATRAGLMNSIRSYLRSGRNGGAWNGNGIASSAAAANTARNTGLAAILNDNGGGTPLMGTFNGVPVDANSILIKYTYDGDSDLDGDVDADDYARIDGGFAQRNSPGFVASYRTGDFDYSNSVNSDDFFLIDRAFSSQGSALGEVVPQAAESAMTVQKTATRKHKHRKRPQQAHNVVKEEWKSVARY
jgi:hypothetical protein